MKFKLRQFTDRWELTPSNRLPARTSTAFMLNFFNLRRHAQKSPKMRAATGFLVRKLQLKFALDDRIAPNMMCPLTARTRGTTRRFTVTRLRLRQEATEGLFPGLRKSSW